jgi:hypothetical protein
MNDTPALVDQLYRDLLLSRSPSERVRMACSMHAAARDLIRAGIPDDAWQTPEDLRLEVFRRFYHEDFTPEEMDRIVAGLRRHERMRTKE